MVGSEDFNSLIKERNFNGLASSDKLQPISNLGETTRTDRKDIKIIPRNEKLGLVRHTSDHFAVRVGCCGAFSLFTGVTLMVWFDLFYLIISLVAIIPATNSLEKAGVFVCKEINKHRN